MGKSIDSYFICFSDKPSTAGIVLDWASSHLSIKGEAITIEPSASALLRTLSQCKAEEPKLIVVCGRTGVSRDQFTPQTISALADYEIPGFGEKMRRESEQYSHNAALSRGGAWLAQDTVVVAVPGKEQAAIECLGIIKDVLAHACLSVQGKCKTRGRVK